MSKSVAPLKWVVFLGTVCLWSGCAFFKPDFRYKPKTAAAYYFPSWSEVAIKRQAECRKNHGLLCDQLRPNDSLSDFMNAWYSKHLKSLKEPKLYNQRGQGLQVVRFTHLGTWGHPYSYRIENNNGRVTATYSKTKGLGGYQAGRRVSYKVKELDQEYWHKILAKLTSVDFWNIQTHDPNLVLDGAEWILEVLHEEQYHLVARTSPDVYDGIAYADLCNLISVPMD